MDSSNLLPCLKLINKLSFNEKSQSIFQELTIAFRYLRNMCAQGAHIQNEIISDHDILNSTHNILNDIIVCKDPSDAAALCFLVGLQFIANLLVNNSEIQENVWHSYHNFLYRCLKYNNIKLQNCAAMIIYNIFLGHSEFMSELENNAFEDIILLTSNGNSSEFALYLLQLFITKTKYIQKVYDTLKPDSKLIIIEAIQDLRKDGKSLNLEIVLFFVKKFLNSCDNILNCLQKMDSPPNAFEMVKILELLSSISSISDGNLKALQTEKSLLINCLMLLKSVHALSKKSENPFSIIQKLSELNEIDKNFSIEEHPCFGFKCSLIRLIGNLCWKHSESQNIVRELEGIPIILDCCNIDGRNPFIIQWTILAIRNICDNNKENQRFIAALPEKGAIDKEKLEKMGILLNKSNDGNVVSIAPVEFKK